MTYLPHTQDERAAMLDAVGVKTLEALFDGLPGDHLFPPLDLPSGISELELKREMRELAARNLTLDRRPSFLGAGIYRHFVPAAVDAVLQRGEFFTAYTPYQPEVSQGMLQATFEYQSMTCALLGMEVSTASHYDGATALAEAVLMALDIAPGVRRTILCPDTLHPQYRAVVRTYLRGTDARMTVDTTSRGISSLTDALDEDVAAVVVQTPNFFGQLEHLEGVADKVHNFGALLIVVVDPVSLGLFAPPGSFDADIVVADGQGLGLAPNFGGPHLGILATRRDHVHRLPGRLVGETVDAQGRRGYVLTLGAREQHIRRARATSNICTNAALSALAAAAHLATLGRSGLQRVAELCYHKAHYAADQLGAVPDIEINPSGNAGTFFKEFVVALPKPAEQVNRILLERHGIIGGHALSRDYPGRDGHMLIAVTETCAKQDIDRLVDGMRDALS
jgi:glycine dehydrogenase subunit 1